MRISDWSSDVCSSGLAVHQPADWHFAHAMVQAHPDIAVVERDVAAMAGISAVEAAIEKEAERVQRAQRVVVGAEISGAKGDRVGRAEIVRTPGRERVVLYV